MVDLFVLSKYSLPEKGAFRRKFLTLNRLLGLSKRIKRTKAKFHDVYVYLETNIKRSKRLIGYERLRKVKRTSGFIPQQIY